MIVLTRSRVALLTVALFGLAACGEGPSPVSPEAPRAAILRGTQRDLLSAPLTGTLPDGVTTYRGTFALQRFEVQNGQLVGVFSFAATLYDASDVVVGTVNEVTSVPASASATCQELNLGIAAIRFPVGQYTLELYDGGPLLAITWGETSGSEATLLCQIAGQLERGNLQAAAGLINQFLILVSV